MIASFLWNAGNLASDEAALSYPWWLFAGGYIGGIAWVLWRARLP